MGQPLDRPTCCPKCGGFALEERNELGRLGIEGLTEGQCAEYLAGNRTAVCLKCGAATDYFDSSDPSPEQVQIRENIRNGQLGEARFKQWCVKNGFYCP